MANLQSYQTPGSCPSKKPAGTFVDLYLTCTCEMDATPQTEAALNAGTDPGDTVTFAENFDFTSAPAGKGYWRKFTVLANKNKFDVTKVGEEGAEALTSGLTFTLPGTYAEEVEFAKCLTEMSGCLSAMMRPRGSTLMEGIGIKELPATVDTITLDGGEKSGDQNSGVYRLKYDAEPWFIDPTAFPIDVTPNP